MIFFNKEKGAILIITLWILVILTLLSVGVASRMGLELKLTGYHRDNMKALYLVKAAINRAIAEKEKDDKKEEKGESPIADILSESWANNEELFKDYNFPATESSTYTIKYTYKESQDVEGVELYGMMDEASKININKIVTGDTVDTTRRQQLIDLLKICQIDDAEVKVDALIDWMDINDTVYGSVEKEDTKYYIDTGVDNYSKNSSLESIEELLLVKYFDSTLLYGNKKENEEEKRGIIDYITIYAEDGKINVNTAPKEVLEALGFAPDLAQDIIDYRKNEAETGEPENQLISQNNLNIAFFKDNIFKRPLDTEAGEETKINNIIINYLTATSNTFRIYATGKVNRVKKRVNCVVALEDNNYNIKYWNEN